MNDNFEWQKQQVNERIQRALQDAATHRLSRNRTRSGSSGTLSLKVAFLLGVVLFLAGLLLTGCTLSASASAETRAIEDSTLPIIPLALTLGERIRFQDRVREQYLRANKSSSQDIPAWSLADRIRFHDRLER